MDFEWDPAKSADCLRRRGFDFDYASRIFDSDDLFEQEDMSAQGEQRYVAIGPVEDQILVVIYTERNGIIRIISARPANKREKKEWQKSASS